MHLIFFRSLPWLPLLYANTLLLFKYLIQTRCLRNIFLISLLRSRFLIYHGNLNLLDQTQAFTSLFDCNQRIILLTLWNYVRQYGGKNAKHIMNGRLHRTHYEKTGSDHLSLFLVVVFISLKIYVVKTVRQYTVLGCDNVNI